MTLATLQQLPTLIYDEQLVALREGTELGESVHYVDGKPVKRSPKLFHVRCMVAPLSGDELLLVPEADRYRQQYSVYADSVRSPALRVNDKLTRKGQLYQIQAVKDWGTFTECRVVAIDTPGEG